MEKAEQGRKWVEEANGIQTQQRQTEGSLYDILKKQQNYDFTLSETFKGDPCPKPAKKGEGTVDGTLTLVAMRTVSGFFSNSVENVATVKLEFHGYVGKAGRLKGYDVAATVEGAGGGWRGSAGATGLKPRASPTAPSAVVNVNVRAVTDKIDTATVARIVSQAVDRGRMDVEKWLAASEGVWFTKAECKRVKGSGLDKPLRRGEQREIAITVDSIRGAHADEEVELKGLNGLQVVSPTGKATAKDGKITVTVRAGSTRELAAGLAPAYALEVEGISELGRAEDTLRFKTDVPTHISGTFSGTATRGGAAARTSITFSGTVTFVRSELVTDPNATLAYYELEKVAYTSSVSITGFCTGTATDSASLVRPDQPGSLSLYYEATPGRGQKYEIDLSVLRLEPGTVDVTCADGGYSTLAWDVSAALSTAGADFYSDGTTLRGSNSVGGETAVTCTWDLTAVEETAKARANRAFALSLRG